jgi:hypothetical protein
VKTKNSRTRRGKSRKPSRKHKPSASDTAAQIINAADSAEALEAYTAILNPQTATTPQELPPTIRLSPGMQWCRDEQKRRRSGLPPREFPRRLRRQEEKAMLSTTALRKRHQLSEPPTEADKLSQVADQAFDAPPETISADGITGSAERLVNELDALYRHAANIADRFGVQTRDVTAKLHAMACGGR